jgi:catechol 2,3-dioxygenase-like lactoylglutathione lyase family enzyme
MFLRLETILYVNNQDTSTQFYTKILLQQPILHVQGMTQFKLTETSVLGLMPNNGIAKIITPKLPHPEKAFGIPKCELYLYVKDIGFYFENALKTEAILISPIEERNWGDKACYFSDMDGHVIAFAEKIIATKI